MRGWIVGVRGWRSNRRQPTADSDSDAGAGRHYSTGTTPRWVSDEFGSPAVDRKTGWPEF